MYYYAYAENILCQICNAFLDACELHNIRKISAYMYYSCTCVIYAWYNCAYMYKMVVYANNIWILYICVTCNIVYIYIATVTVIQDT